MSKRLSALVLLSLAAIGGGPSGCGPSDETLRIKLVPVDGKVTLNGKPLAGATITFTPDESNEYQTPGSDVTGPEGNFKVMFRGRSGLYPGNYKVVVEKTQSPPGGPLVQQGDEGMLAELQRHQIGPAGAQTKDAPSPIRGEFDGEVPAGGGSLDFNVKGQEAPVKGSKP
jgi:hypothetical protein